MPKVEDADFDTNLFGFRVGRIEINPSEPVSISTGVVLQGLLRNAYGTGIKLIYLFAPPVDVSNESIANNESVIVTLKQNEGQLELSETDDSASAPGAQLVSSEKNLKITSQIPGIMVDIKSTFTALLSSFDRSTLVVSAFLGSAGINVIRINRSNPGTVSPALRELAIASGVWSRFKVDTNVPHRVFEGIFEGWIKNSINFSIADEVFIAVDSSTGTEVGLITLKQKGLVVSIGLLAVSPQHRRKGIASQLLSRAVLWAMETVGVEGVLSVVTQGANEQACNCYKRFGLALNTEQKVYHIWLPQHLDEPLLRADQGPIPFCKQFMTGNEQQYVSEVFAKGLDSAARFTIMCAIRIKEILGSESERVVMVPSGTAALEMAALLSNLEEGDEVIMPSYTFSSTANAFVLRGVVPVFVDVRTDTFNINELLIEQAITSKTKAICAVHYGGVPCEMDTICEIAAKHNLLVIEDAAQGFLSTYKGRQLGTIGDFGCFSFHYTKNIICGEGGALSINRSSSLARRALVLWEKGTNRYDFMAGKIDKYEWIDLGSSYVPNEVSCAILWAQLEHSIEITSARLANFATYSEGLSHLHEKGVFRIPCIPAQCQTNAHIFSLLIPSSNLRIFYEEELKKRGVSAFSHYVPLHSSPAGKKFGRVHGDMAVTDSVFAGLIRLPLWVGLRVEELQYVIHAVEEVALLAELRSK